MVSERLANIFKAGLEAADPYNAVRKTLTYDSGRLIIAGESYDLDRYERVVVAGAGKASARMALAVEDTLGPRLEGGVVIVKYGHGARLGRIRQFEAGHPLPDEAGVAATQEMLSLVRVADEKTLVLALISGGASALMVAPAEGITLDELRAATDALLACGAEIGELNTVRKHLSLVKGGRLAQAASPAALVTLIVSDVIGDRLDTIASGPTVADPTTFSQALSIIERYGVGEAMSASVMDRLKAGASGEVAETPKGHEPFFEKTRNIVVAGLAASIDAARTKALSYGFEPRVLTAGLKGEARIAARYLAQEAGKAVLDRKKGAPPVCLISGGETTVTIKGNGLGGRNQELALAFALELEKAGLCGVTLLSAGTDGTDGPTDAAGAIVDCMTVSIARQAGLDAAVFLEDNDSCHFFERLDTAMGMASHFKTGPTGTNVMDMQIVVVKG